jgi:hypothetical protein
MPLNDHEQRILEEIERHLAEEDPRFAEQVGRADLYTHLARRIRLAALALVAGFIAMLVLFVSGVVWGAAAGFVVVLLSTAVIYRALGQLGRDQLRALQEDGGFSLAGLLGRIASRFRNS